VVILTGALLSSCTFLSNRDYSKQYAPFQGVQRIAVFLQHWPFYLQKSGRNSLGEDFIRPQTIFLGPWQPAGQVNPRAVDIQDIDDGLMGEILVRILEEKGYQVFLVNLPFAGESVSAEMLMAQYQAINPPVDAFLFCYYAPTLFVSHAREAPKDHAQRSYSLGEIVQGLSPRTDSVIWVGQRDQNSPADSISHAFIYLAFTIFKASNWQTLMAEADSQVGGQVRAWIPRCPPAPTAKNYGADPGIIERLMVNNLKCRLRHQIPDAF
jgi:predicted CoA-binding protein